MKITEVNTPKAPKAVGPYVQANKVGNLIFCSGQLGINPETGKIVEGGVIEEAKQVFKNIEAVLEEAGSSMNHVVKSLVLLKDIASNCSVYFFICKIRDITFQFILNDISTSATFLSVANSVICLRYLLTNNLWVILSIRYR